MVSQKSCGSSSDARREGGLLLQSEGSVLRSRKTCSEKDTEKGGGDFFSSAFFRAAFFCLIRARAPAFFSCEKIPEYIFIYFFTEGTGGK